MKLTPLRYFQGICRWGSLSRAARELHISQSVLSGTIKELEEEFGVLLFSRSGRGLVLTKEGEFFLGEDSFLTNYMEEQFKIRGAKLNAVLYTNQLAAVGQIVREGTAAAFLFEGVLPPEPEVAVIPVEDLPAARVCLVRKEGRKLSPCAGQFIRMVKEAGGDGGRAFLPLYCKMRPGKNPMEKSEEKFGKIEG